MSNGFCNWYHEWTARFFELRRQFLESDQMSYDTEVVRRRTQEREELIARLKRGDY